MGFIADQRVEIDVRDTLLNTPVWVPARVVGAGPHVQGVGETVIVTIEATEGPWARWFGTKFQSSAHTPWIRTA